MKVHPKAQARFIDAHSKKEFFLIHGYSGSPSDFNQLEKVLHRTFNASVRVVRLPGHGTHVSDLDQLYYDDFYSYVSRLLSKDLRTGKKVVLIGHSLGGLLALDLASHYPVQAVASIGAPYQFKFPFNLRITRWVSMIKRHWKKKLSPLEKEWRKKSFYYSYIHRNGLIVSRTVRDRLTPVLKKIKIPSVFLHAKDEGLCDYRSSVALYKEIGSSKKKIHIYKSTFHNLFYSPFGKHAINQLVRFFRKNKVFD